MPAKFAIFTPLHLPGNAYIKETWASLKAQSFKHWHWYILENNGGKTPKAIADDPRVSVIQAHPAIKGIGALKREACYASSIEPWMVELDNDDVLESRCLEELAKAFNAGAGFVYSNCAEFIDDGSGVYKPNVYRADCGWTWYSVKFRKQELLAIHAAPATPQNLRRIEFSPNHVRAWTREAYATVGGHDLNMTVGDDHDLMVRMYLAGVKFVHIPKCLYFYRVHKDNTVITQNSDIQAATEAVYIRNIWALAHKFADDENLMKVDLCGAVGAPKDYFVLDKHDDGGPNPGLCCDLNEVWPLDDNRVGVLRAFDALEHLRDPIHTMNEAYRVLAPGGFFMISVPSTDGKGAFCDPTHVSYWNDLSFRYYTQEHFAKYIQGFTGKFQLVRLINWFPTPWHRMNNVPYVEAQLIAIKPGYKPYGEAPWSEK